MKTFYSEYVRHCMKFYTRYPHPSFENEIDKLNWTACEEAMKNYTDTQRRILVYVYNLEGVMPENVFQTARACGVGQDAVWRLVKDLERRIAKGRQLIY